MRILDLAMVGWCVYFWFGGLYLAVICVLVVSSLIGWLVGFGFLLLGGFGCFG